MNPILVRFSEAFTFSCTALLSKNEKIGDNAPQN